jgi:hypothetical protein
MNRRQQKKRMSENFLEKGVSEALGKLLKPGIEDLELDLEIINPVKRRWLDWLDLLSWQPEDGPDEGIFTFMSAGYRCLWSCAWMTSQGLIVPNQLLPTSDMSDIQMQYEIEDSLITVDAPAPKEHDHFGNDKGRWLLQELRGNPEDEGLRETIRNYLGQRRGRYRSYIATWDLPPGIIYRLIRPGGWNFLDPDDRAYGFWKTIKTGNE